jgi:uncharacterized protein YndB with AHSA1/START domain
MKRMCEASVKIDAPKETVWRLLTDAAGYADWNTTVDRVEGEIEPGARLKIFAKIAPGKAFPANVSTFEAPEHMVWSFSGPLGMFKGARSFKLTVDDDGRVEFHTREEFGGWMAGPIIKRMPDLQPSFDEFAASLKRAAEAA